MRYSSTFYVCIKKNYTTAILPAYGISPFVKTSNRRIANDQMSEAAENFFSVALSSAIHRKLEGSKIRLRSKDEDHIKKLFP